jgi:hypothetical protein
MQVILLAGSAMSQVSAAKGLAKPTWEGPARSRGRCEIYAFRSNVVDQKNGGPGIGAGTAADACNCEEIDQSSTTTITVG